MSGRPRSWTDEQLIEAAARCRSIAEVIRTLGLKASGGTHQHIRHRMRLLNLDLPNRDPWAWMREPGANKGGRVRTFDEVLTHPSPMLNVGKLRERLIRAGLKDRRCEVCGISEWQGHPLPLHLDHIDGDRTNNLLENLRMLCPNCHALTPTWCRRKDKLPPT